jgi:hypothetical protein
MANHNRLSNKWHNTRRSAQMRGLSFTLTQEEFNRLLLSPCVYGSWRHSDITPVGLDRKDNSVGYTEHNSAPCCSRHNTIKGSWFTHDQMLDIVACHPLLQECGRGASMGPNGKWSKQGFIGYVKNAPIAK